MGGDPAVQIAAPQGHPRLADHPGRPQGLAAGPQVAPSEAQQLGDGGRPALTPFQRHERKIECAAPAVDHQHPATRGQTGTDRRCGRFVHQGHFGNGQLPADPLQPLAVTPVGLDGGRQHQAIRAQLGR